MSSRNEKVSCKAIIEAVFKTEKLFKPHSQIEKIYYVRKYQNHQLTVPLNNANQTLLGNAATVADHQTILLGTAPHGKKIIKARYVFKRKNDGRYKAEIVAKGYSNSKELTTTKYLHR